MTPTMLGGAPFGCGIEGGPVVNRDEADHEDTAGRKAERLVFDRLRAALPDRIEILPNVRWIARDHGHEIEGEADLVVADPDRGLLVLEVKAGEIRPRAGDRPGVRSR